MSAPKVFPVLEHDRPRGEPKYTGPRSVPWDFIAEHEAQCKVNHDQTVQRLAERGGLGADEMCAVVEDRRWHRMSLEDATERLVELLEAWLSKRGADYARGRADALRDAVAVLRKCSEGQPRDGWMFGVEWSIEKLEAMR